MFKKKTAVSPMVGVEEPLEPSKPKHNTFFLSKAIALQLKDLDKCCCSDVPCISIIKEYCECSTLHGLRYITEDGRHWTERVLWFFLSLCGLILTIYFIVPIWSKWNSKPTLTTLDSANYPIWEVEFPGVTICSPNKVNERKLNEVLAKPSWIQEISYTNSSKGDFSKLLEFLVRFDQIDVEHDLTISDKAKFESIISQIGHTRLVDTLLEVMPNCNDQMLKCWWQGEVVNCSEIFDVRQTDEGFCCSFNTVRQSENIDLTNFLDGRFLATPVSSQTITTTSASPEIQRKTLFDNFETNDSDRFKRSFEEEFFGDTNEDILGLFDHLLSDGQAQKNQSDTGSEEFGYLRRVNTASYRKGLTVLMDAKSDEYFITTDDFVGFKILIHNPRSYPELRSKGLVIGSGLEHFVAVSTSFTEGSNSIRDFSVEGRNCLFKDERSVTNSEVTIFKSYTEENCLLECRARHLINVCGCLPYYYPRLDILLHARSSRRNEVPIDNDTMSNMEGPMMSSSCDLRGMLCLSNSSDLLDAVRPLEGQNSRFLNGSACSCPPSCSRTTYDPAITSASFPNSVSNIPKGLRKSGLSFKDADLSLVHVYYQDLKIIKYYTDELFSWQDILAAFGGLVGLCTGSSFLSAAELVYFFTLRCSLQLCKRPRRSNNLSDIEASDLVVVKVE